MPEIQLPNETIEIKGRINRFPRLAIELAGGELPGDNWPAIIQRIDADVLSQKLGYRFYHFQVELDSAAASGYNRDWAKTQTMPPEKHRAYAVQWFFLALTLTILFVKYGFNRPKD